MTITARRIRACDQSSNASVCLAGTGERRSGLSVQREVMEMNVMPILLWVVLPFAIWSACFTPPSLLGKTGEKPTDLGGG